MYPAIYRSGNDGAEPSIARLADLEVLHRRLRLRERLPHQARARASAHHRDETLYAPPRLRRRLRRRLRVRLLRAKRRRRSGHGFERAARWSYRWV